MPGFPVSLLLIGMIYTSTKALQYLSIPVYTIFKNLTIILIAYGEVLWFGGSVTGMALFSFGLMVMSSVIAAWADIQHALQSLGHASPEASDKISTLNAGYMWMMINCFCSAAYVLGMRKRIKLTNFKDFDSRSSSSSHQLTISHVLQQSSLHPDPRRGLLAGRKLVLRKYRSELPAPAPQQHHHGHGLLRLIVCLHLLHLGLVCTCDVIHNVLDGRRLEQAADCGQRSCLLRCACHNPERLSYWRWVCQRHCVCNGKGPTDRPSKDGHLTHDESHGNEREQPQRAGLAQILIYSRLSTKFTQTYATTLLDLSRKVIPSLMSH